MNNFFVDLIVNSAWLNIHILSFEYFHFLFMFFSVLISSVLLPFSYFLTTDLFSTIKKTKKDIASLISFSLLFSFTLYMLILSFLVDSSLRKEFGEKNGIYYIYSSNVLQKTKISKDDPLNLDLSGVHIPQTEKKEDYRNPKQKLICMDSLINCNKYLQENLSMAKELFGTKGSIKQ